MAKINFTRSNLSSLKPGQTITDAGFGGYSAGTLQAKATKSGSVTASVKFMLNGKQVRRTVRQSVGYWIANEGGTPAQLREEARKTIEEARNAPEKRGEEVKVETIAELGELYLARRAENTANYRAYADGGLAARKAVARAAAIWGDKPLTDLTVGDAERLIDHVTSKHGPEAALQARRLLQPMLRFPMKLGIKGVPTDLFRDVKTPRNDPRDVVLTPEERKRFFDAVRQFEQPQSNRTKRRAAVSQDSVDILRLIYLTAARKGEVFKAQWGEIDLEAGTWFRPADKRKKRNEHLQYLTPDAVKVLERVRARRQRLRQHHEGEGYVFPTNTPGRGKPYRTTVWSAFQTILKIAGLEDKGLHIHDLRASRITSWNREAGRSFHEIAKDIGSSPEVLERVYGREPDTAEQRRQRMVMEGDSDLI